MRATLVLALLALASCGREDIELAPSSDGGVAAGDGSLCEGPDLPRKCQGLGASCSVGSECCSGRCIGHECLEAGACAAPGASCATRAECCSGRCEPVGANDALVCLDYCKRDGEACARALDCCGLSCTGGTCGGTFCKREGQDCLVASECCGDLCSGGKCGLSVTACRPTAEDCTSGGGLPCCSGACTSGGRCALGPGPCRPAGAICDVDADCCRGTCVDIGDNTRVCMSACLVAGAACVTSADCCAGLACGGNPSVCGTPESACKLLGASCAGDAECCSAMCAGGFCGTTCAIP